MIISKNKCGKGGKYEYEHLNGSIDIIDSNTKTCTCNTFIDKAVCKHLAGVCMIEKIELNGLKPDNNRFANIRRRK